MAKRTTCVRRGGLGVAAVMVAVAGSAAWAQQGRDGPQERPGVRDAQPEGDRPMLEAMSPERFRARLADLLPRLEDSAERLRGAIAALDEGKTVAEVIDQLGGPLRVRQLADMWQQWGRQRLGSSENRGPDWQGERLGEGPPGAQGFGADDPPWVPREVAPDEVLVFLRDQAPRLAERLSALREDDPGRADAFLLRMAPRVSEVLSTEAHDPELGKLLREDFGLGMRFVDAAEHYRRARESGDDAAVEQAAAALRELAGQQVDLRLARREHELKMLAHRLEAMQDEINEQRADREELIEDMIGQAGRGRFRGGPEGDRPGRGGPPEGTGRRDRRSQPGE